MSHVTAPTDSAAAQFLASSHTSLMHGWVPVTTQALAAVVLVVAVGWRSRRWRTVWLPVAALAGGVAGLVAALYDVLYWYPGNSWASFGIPYLALTAASSVVIAGFGAWSLTRALVNTGVLDRFPAGRERAAV